MKALFSLLLCIHLTLSAPVYRNDVERQIYCCAPNAEKKIALTFDDGPHPQYTMEILTVLRQYGVKATFFTIGENVQYYPDAFAAIEREGHEIGNHTFSHPHLQTQNAKSLTEELLHTEELLSAEGQKRLRLFRPPEGVCSDTVCRVAAEMGYSIILWTVDTRDWDHTPAKTIVENVMHTVKSGDIILFHDYITSPSPTPDALRQLIPALLRQGYQFVTVSELIG
ncbi:MAG: polysaccharide deacetylase family protein [Ruminococcaceae bacterium]|nr:polysaccharide deacetylase family protein [Oscillospiraceae bacterium]